MQLLIDTATETPGQVRTAAYILLMLAEGAEPTNAALESLMAGSFKRPAPPPVGPAPTPPAEPAPLPPGNVPPSPVDHPERHPDATVPELDPAAVFARVPAGTTADPPAAGDAMRHVPPAPGNLPASVPPGPTTAQTSALLVTTTGAGGGEVPWDARVHSETRKKNADGSWRFRRNLDQAVKDAVMAELRAQVPLSLQQPPVALPSGMPVPAAPPAVPQPPVAATSMSVPPPPPAGAVSVPEPPNTVIPFPGATPVPVPPANNTGVPNPAQSHMVPTVTGFRELMGKINQALAHGRLTQGQLTQACKDAGVDTVSALAAQPMLVPLVDANINAITGATAVA